MNEKQIESQAEQKKSGHHGSESAPVQRAEVQIPQSIVDRYDASQKETHRKETLSSFFQGMTLVIVAAYTALTYQQWQAMLQQNSNAQRALEVTERAYVNVQSVRLGQPFKVGNIPEAIVDYENSGLTPAKELWIVPVSEISSQPIPASVQRTQRAADWCETMPSGEILPPKILRHRNTNIDKSTATPIPMSQIGQVINEANHGMVETGLEYWSINVSISYRDQFGHCHWTVEPFHYNPKTDEFDPFFMGFHQVDK